MGRDNAADRNIECERVEEKRLKVDQFCRTEHQKFIRRDLSGLTNDKQPYRQW